MSDSKTLSRLTVCSLVTAMCGAGTGAFAHTGIKDSGTEGEKAYTAFVITHGCSADHDAPQIPVKAQAAVFPNPGGAVAKKLIPEVVDPNTGTVVTPGSEEEIPLEEVIEGGIVGLSVSAIKDRNVFEKVNEVTDPNLGNVVALHYTEGNLDPELYGLQPFRITAPIINPESCVTGLQLRMAVANWCTRSKDESKDDRVDVWVGHNTTLFDDVGVSSAESNGPGAEGFWPTMTIARTSPLPASCGGVGYEVAIQPTDADIDAYLPIRGYWPN